ncbi:hypothetical protein M3Y99_01573500 [Aphelenchoides fujianensis]|nr:hypothetical protein M3Y99_01573500 [Aphelenchoides fujianensis]
MPFLLRVARLGHVSILIFSDLHCRFSHLREWTAIFAELKDHRSLTAVGLRMYCCHRSLPLMNVLQEFLSEKLVKMYLDCGRCTIMWPVFSRRLLDEAECQRMGRNTTSFHWTLDG